MGNQKALRWERRPDERPQQLLDAALRVFAERGYRNTRLEEVADAAGVTKGTIYHYFSTKEELLLRAVEHYHETAFGQMAELLHGAGGPPSARIRLLIRKGFGRTDELGRNALLLLVQGIAHEVPDVYRRWLATGPLKGWRLLAELIEEGKATGEFRASVDSDVAARMMLWGILLQIVWQRYAPEVPDLALDHDRLIDSSVELFLHGLRPPVIVTAGAGFANEVSGAERDNEANYSTGEYAIATKGL